MSGQFRTLAMSFKQKCLMDKLPQLIRRCCNLQLQLVNEVHEMCTCKTTPHVSQCILEVWVWTDSFLMYALWCVEYTQHLLPITDKDESAHFSLLRIWNFSESFCVEDTVQVFCVPFVPGPAFCLGPRPICVVSTVFYQRIILSVSNQPKYPTPAPSDSWLIGPPTVGPRSPTVCPK